MIHFSCNLATTILLLGPAQLTMEVAPVASGTLVVGILSVESSYQRNLERPAEKVPDTIQFWLSGQVAWRVRTFAIDHDIHMHTLDLSDEDGLRFARTHIQDNYGGVLFRVVVLDISADPANDLVALRSAGLEGAIERASNGVIFWNPDSATYRTQSTPR